MSTRQKILKHLTDAGFLLTADQLATALEIPTPQMRAFLRSMVEDKEIEEVTPPNARVHYQLKGRGLGMAPETGAQPPPPPVNSPRPNAPAAPTAANKPAAAKPASTPPAATVAPSPALADLLAQAESAPLYTSGRSANMLAEFTPVIDALRVKGYSWKAVADWLKTRGVKANAYSAEVAHKAWKAAQPKAAA